MLLNPLLKKLSCIKPIKKQQKTIEGIFSHGLNVMVTKVTQIVSFNLFVPAREISDLIPRITSALRSFPIFLNIDFPQLLDIQEKMLKFHINVQKRFKKTPEWAVRLTLLLGYHHIHFSFRQYWFLSLDVIIVFEID